MLELILISLIKQEMTISMLSVALRSVTQSVQNVLRPYAYLKELVKRKEISGHDVDTIYMSKWLPLNMLLSSFVPFFTISLM
jgi:hypothetical protein